LKLRENLQRAESKEADAALVLAKAEAAKKLSDAKFAAAEAAKEAKDAAALQKAADTPAA
jgi:hypothetical protein